MNWRWIRRELIYIGIYIAFVFFIFSYVLIIPRWDLREIRFRGDYEFRGDTDPTMLTMAELCEYEARWFETLAERCRNRLGQGRPWDANDEGARLLKTQFTLHDLPTRPGWGEQAKYFDRRAAKAWKSARDYRARSR